ncbi:MAG: UvrD-helicase domain-containing protein [Anaeroplasmataceae bacterium]|nr:UvrD-helicase domain-containing protein [Anaeroplasmataceae bacterium]MDE6414967.1 UvrD-helicase domain-containing protein [Anaeroplasmataceae bacterium]
MAWTEMQNQAIHKRGGNCIVSAGAGSGKTAVLSERILTYCLDGKDICSFLVLTFTNAAAAEMKERIRKKLNDHNLKEQASRIDSAFITTFDAYSLALVKKYYFYLNVDKDITIMDQALLEVKKKEIVDALFEELYTNKNPRFFSLLSKYTKQNDETVKKMILSILAKLELIVEEEEFCKQYEENYYNDSFIEALVAQYEKLALEKCNELYQALLKLASDAGTDSASDKLFEEVNRILSTTHLKSYDEAASWLNTVSLPRIHPKAMDYVKSQKAYCGELLKEIKLKYFSKYVFLEEAKRELYAIKDDVLYLLELALEIKHRLDDYKCELMAFDYMDIAKMAIRLVKTNPTVLEEIKNSFTEILIDEYQDTSDIQEAFIACISNHNCYMVGDIKQSIYRFRNANPYIFKEKYSRYSNLEDGIKIDLTHNFRSRKEVVEDINLIFSNLMTLAFGDANYAYEHMMRFGQKEYEKSLNKEDYHMNILTYDAQEGFSDEEVEAFICGSKIKELMSQNHLCLKKDKFEPLKYSDIAILMDKTKSFITFKKVFEYLGIPLAIEADVDLNDSILPKLFSNIFLCIVSKYENIVDKPYEHALVSVGRSFLFGFDDSTLYAMIKEHQQNELTALVETLSKEIKDLALEEIYYRIVEDFRIYEKLSLIGEVNSSCLVLEYIHNLFMTMASAGMGIKEACSYFASIFENQIALKYKMSEDSKNCVHMMTIHKSKGLEFPYCIFPMLGSKFNQADIKENFGLSSTYGLYIPFSDEANSNTIIKSLVDEETKKADLSEKIRLFYVALTRAREKIILISKNLDVEEPISLECVASFNQLLYTKQFFKEYHCPVDASKLGLTLKYRMVKHSLKGLVGKPIAYQEDSFLSEIKEKKAISKELVELTDSNLKRAIELGKRFHECLEVLDFQNIQIDALPVDDFMKQSLHKVLATPVFKNIKNAKTYHEHEFYFDSYHGIIDLLCIYSDHIDIIDYKLSGTESEEYLRQLSVYKTYVEAHSSLPVSCYLLSILKQEVKKVL